MGSARFIKKEFGQSSPDVKARSDQGHRAHHSQHFDNLQNGISVRRLGFGLCLMSGCQFPVKAWGGATPGFQRARWGQAPASCLAILASVRAMASRNMRDSSGVEGRPPISITMRSNSLSDIKEPVNLPVRSMREEVCKVDFGVLLKVADGIAKSLVVIQCREPELSAQALNSPENVAMRESVCGVVSGNVNPLSAMHGEQNDGKRVNFPADGFSADLQREGSARDGPFLFRHKWGSYAALWGMGITFFARAGSADFFGPGVTANQSFASFRVASSR